MWSPIHAIAYVQSVLFEASERREERGAAFTEYVVLVGAVVAFVLLIGFTALGNALTTKIGSIAAQINA